MEISNMESNPISVPNLCEWCGGAGTCRCGRCHVVYYCSKEHQMQHWAMHKKICKKSAPPVIPPVSNMSHNLSLVSNMSHIPSASDLIHIMPSPSNMSHNMPSPSNMSHNMPSPSNMSHNMPSSSNINPNLSSASNMNHNMPSASSMSHDMLSTSSMSHNMPSSSNMNPNLSSASNMNHNMPSASSMSHDMLSTSSMSHNMPSTANMNHMNVPSTSNLTFSSTANWTQSNISTHINEDISRFSACGSMFDSNNSCIPSEKPMDFNTASVEDLLSSISNDLLSSDNSFWNLIDTCNAQDVSDLEMYLSRDGMNQMSAPQNPSPASNISNANTPCVNDDDKNLIEGQPLSEVCQDIIADLNDYGICLFDNFLGSKRGNLILDEVKRMYTSGVFEKGKLVKSSAYIPSEIIRSDVMTWVNGTEPYCENIGYLIQKLDLVIATCNKMPNNGQLSNYKLHRRTKAMVACYPGNRTHYKRHVDNPNKDGRCITCIYYLNQNWDSKIHGGLLRMFPSLKGEVAEIEPIFDRMIFFWSDRRNPHEVLPALATRFAITVWYFDADEREESLRKQQEKGEHPQ